MIDPEKRERRRTLTLETLAKAARIKMTGTEISAQRKSWVIGEMMLEHPEMTRAEAERLFNQLGF